MSMSQSAHDAWKISPELARLTQAYVRVRPLPDAKHPWPLEMLFSLQGQRKAALRRMAERTS